MDLPGARSLSMVRKHFLPPRAAQFIRGPRPVQRKATQGLLESSLSCICRFIGWKQRTRTKRKHVRWVSSVDVE